MRQQYALIRYHLHLDPDVMDDDTFYRIWGELEWVLKIEGKLDIK